MAVRHQLVRRPLHAPWKVPADESRHCERVAGTHSASADERARPGAGATPHSTVEPGPEESGGHVGVRRHDPPRVLAGGVERPLGGARAALGVRPRGKHTNGVLADA
ncbi:hypothetical protein ACIP93_13990 [Streptomyces sp. NPDC088745]|uniref:hypothetical protein n=1 Tax=Streptomyces sp. NPDC088745 TaxID=3365884 RepID=UPI0037F4AE56